MPDYSKYATPISSSDSGVESHAPDDRFTAKFRFSDFASEARERWRPVDKRFAIRDIIAHLEEYEPSRQLAIATGVALTLSQLMPEQLRFFLDLLKQSPVCADTADRVLESLHFMNSHDRSRE